MDMHLGLDSCCLQRHHPALPRLNHRVLVLCSNAMSFVLAPGSTFRQSAESLQSPVSQDSLFQALRERLNHPGRGQSDVSVASSARSISLAASLAGSADAEALYEELRRLEEELGVQVGQFRRKYWHRQAYSMVVWMRTMLLYCSCITSSRFLLSCIRSCNIVHAPVRVVHAVSLVVHTFLANSPNAQQTLLRSPTQY